MSLKTLDSIVQSGTKLTPMMEQYYELKQKVPDILLLFRMGDFYEVFFEDAQKTARLLNITLTHRGKLGDTPIPMAGIPHHAANAYIDRLTALGEKVAICEQIQDPKEAKGIVKRGITQIASPGMPFDLEKADAKSRHYMMAGLQHQDKYYLAMVDYTTGEFSGSVHNSSEEFLEKIKLQEPKEFVSTLGQWDHLPVMAQYFEHASVVVTHLSQEYLEPKFSELYTQKLAPGLAKDRIIKLTPEILSPIGMLAFYICSTQDHESYAHIQPFKMLSDKQSLKISQATLVGLEILPRNRDSYKSSVLGFFDRTKTAMGSRQIKSLFLNPLMCANEITQRQDLVHYLLEHNETLSFIRQELEIVRDLERIMAKLATGKAQAGDLLQLAHATEVFGKVNSSLKNAPTQAILPQLKPSEKKSLESLAQTIYLTINDEIGASLEKGNLIRPGCRKERDKLARLATNAADELLKLEAGYREKTGITKLRIKHNNVNGYFIEVSKGQSENVPKWFSRRQTLVNCERYVTDELVDFEKEVLLAKDKLERLEREIFKDLIAQALDQSQALRGLAAYLSLIDCFQSFAYIAWQEGLSRPEILREGKEIKLEGAWHPLIKAAIKDQFICHDLNLNQKVYFGLITGPNMAGKTTVMREVAIIQLLTQMGSFVPAQKVRVSLCDYLFSRLGASDDILRGQSTFMVEMSETAEILRHATERSLIILDEVGRGTSTYDGLSIAWALVEHFVHQTKALTLFATHYHELIEVVDNLSQAKNLTVETLNNGGQVQFLYRLIEKAASQSFGLYVAQLAGLPKSVLHRSEILLKELEQEQQIQAPAFKLSGNQLSFLSDEEEVKIPEHLIQLEKKLSELDVMSITPIQALQKLQDLKDLGH